MIDTLALDIETNAKDPRYHPEFRVLGVSYASDHGNAGYVPLGHRSTTEEQTYMGMRTLRKLLGSHSRYVLHNAKFDLVGLQRIGISLWGEDWYCTMLMQHMVNENLPSKALDYLGMHHFKEGKAKDQAFDDFVNVFGWGFLSVNMIEEYAIQDARLTLKLFHKLYPEFIKQGFASPVS